MAETKVVPPYSSQKDQELTVSDYKSEVGFHDYLHVLMKRKEIFGGAIIFCLLIAFLINTTQRPVYQSAAEIVIQPKDLEVSSSSATLNVMQDPTFHLTQVRMVRGLLLAEKIIKKMEGTEPKKSLLDCFGIKSLRKSLKESVLSDAEHRALVNAVRSSLSIAEVETGARILLLSARGYVPIVVKQLVDAAAASYVEATYELQIEAFKKSFSVISKSLGEIRDKIKTSEMALQKVGKEIELLEALKIYDEKYPLVISLRMAIPDLANKLQLSINNLEKMEIGRRMDGFSILTTPHLDLLSLAPLEVDLQTLKPILEQETRTNRDMYNSIFRKLQEVEISGGSNAWLDAKVLELGVVPGNPIRPNKKLNLLVAFLVGITMGAGLAYLLEYLDSSLRSLDDVRSYLKVFPLGMVPQVEFEVQSPTEDPFRLPFNQKVRSKVRSYWNTTDATIPLYVSEAYRIIRTNLAFGSVDRALKVIQVTSAIKGEGKTTTACNLGISLAQTGMRILLIDADMRRPSLHKILELGRGAGGLSNALTNGDSWETYIRPSVEANLSCLTAGDIPPNPAELLSSKRMKTLLAELRDHFEMIILDSPPVISVADSSVIASCVDGIILVSKAGFIPRHICLKAKHALESVHGKIVGCILNAVKSQHHSYYDQRYYGSEEYGYYAQSKGEKVSGKRASRIELSTRWEKIKALREPFFLSLSAVWIRIIRFIKSERSRNEASSKDDSK